MFCTAFTSNQLTRGRHWHGVANFSLPSASAFSEFRRTPQAYGVLVLDLFVLGQR